MRRKSAISPAPAWPFWLLLAAWFCANTPQIAFTTAMAWLGEARRFSHQTRLSEDVAYLLTSQERPSAVATAERPTDAPPLPPVPADSLFKKLDLGLEAHGEPWFVAALPRSNRAIDIAVPAARCIAPPHEPPRSLELT